MTNKERYYHLCEAEEYDIPLFLQYWWMDLVCHGKQWDVALSVGSTGEVLGAMPYLIGSKMGMRYVLQPQLTQYNGPWYNYASLRHGSDEAVSEYQRLGFEKRTAADLIAQISALRLSCFCQCFSPEITNWQPFYEQGFSQTTRYTYRINDISDSQRVFAAFTDKRRQKILRADSCTSLSESVDAEWFADFHIAYWRSKGQSDLLPRQFMVGLCREAISRHAGAILRLCDEEEKVLAAIFVVFDKRCAYLLLSANSVEQYRNENMSILIWKALQWLSSKCRAFDFEGSMIPGKEQFNRSFGAIQTPFFQVSRYSNPLIEWIVKHKR